MLNREKPRFAPPSCLAPRHSTGFFPLRGAAEIYPQSTPIWAVFLRLKNRDEQTRRPWNAITLCNRQIATKALADLKNGEEPATPRTRDFGRSPLSPEDFTVRGERDSPGASRGADPDVKLCLTCCKLINDLRLIRGQNPIFHTGSAIARPMPCAPGVSAQPPGSRTA